MNCLHCGSTDVHRSRRRGLVDKLRSWLGQRPYRCHTCMHRFFAPSKDLKELQEYSAFGSDGSAGQELYR